MCARYKITTPPGVIISEFSIRVGRLNVEPRYNIAPTQAAPVVRLTAEGRAMSMLRWGLIPSWAKDAKIAFSTINARAETVAEKPAFREAFKTRRALVVADGYYEWKTEADGKQPYLFERTDGKPMAFAGLWDRWTPPGTDNPAEVIESFTIIVTAANALAAQVHDRMPVILEPHQFDMWLDAAHTPPEAVTDFLRPYESDVMHMRAVSRAINSVRNEGEAALAEPPRQGLLL